MSEASPLPRDDRAWPSGALGVSLVGGAGSLAASAALVADADSVGRAADLVFVFTVLAVLEGVAWVAAMNAWLQGRRVPRRTRGTQVVLVALVLLAFAGGLSTGAAALCGTLAGIFLPSASAIRYARVYRVLVDRGEPGLGEERDAEASREEPLTTRRARPSGAGPARTAVSLAGALRDVLTEDRDVWLAWAAATGVAALCFVAAGASTATVAVVVVLGLLALTGMFRRLDRVWAAVQRFLDGSEEHRGAEVARVTGVVSEETPGTIGWFTMFAWRFSGLVLVGLLVAWWD